MSFLNFEPDILERIDSLSRSQDQQRKLFEELASTLVDRQKLEEFYARSLERLCEGLSKIKISPASDYPKHVISTLISLFSTEAEQSSVFAQSLASDVIPVIKEACKEDAILLKNMSKVGERHENDLIRNVNAFEMMRKQYTANSQTLIQKLKQVAADTQRKPLSNGITSNTSYTNNNDLIKEQAILNCMQRAKLDSENEFEKQITKYNKYIDEYFVDVARLEGLITSQENAKRDILSDTMMKIMVFKVSFLRSLQYDVDRVTSKLSSVETKVGLKQFLSEILAASSTQADKSRSSSRGIPAKKPLLTKLHFDNYKQNIDSSLKLPAEEQQNTLPPKEDANNNNVKPKPRSKIFSSAASGTSQQMSLGGVVSFERRGQQPVTTNLANVGGEVGSSRETTVPKNMVNEERVVPNSVTSNKEKQTAEVESVVTVVHQNVVKTPHIKQPNEIIIVDILKLIESKSKKSKNPDGVVEIEREDFFEYLLLKVWHNNEVMGYDIDQLRGILSGVEGRTAFSDYFIGFFSDQIRAQKAHLISLESNAAERILLEKTIAMEVEISSDAYTQLMRVLYCLLDVVANATVGNDLHSISRVFAVAKQIFKVIRPPDENIVCFQRIYLHEGLSGHGLFRNDVHWQEKLNKIVDEIEEAYAQKIKVLASADSIEDSRLAYVSEAQFVVQELQEIVKDLFGFAIPKARITALVQYLTVSSEVKTEILKFIESYQLNQTTILQTDGSLNLNDKKRSSVEAIENYSTDQSSLSQLQQVLSSQGQTSNTNEMNADDSDHNIKSHADNNSNDGYNDGDAQDEDDEDENECIQDFVADDSESSGDKKNSYFLDGLS